MPPFYRAPDASTLLIAFCGPDYHLWSTVRQIRQVDGREMIRAPAQTEGSRKMDRTQDKSSSRDPSITRWEDDGGCVHPDLPYQDLNSLLAQEQTSIMNAESSATRAAYEFHRDASLHTRQLVNATAYPEHGAYVFAEERATKAADYDENLRALMKIVDRNESLLARQFADGGVSSKAYQTRSRFLRQDRTRLPDMSHVAPEENGP